METLTYRFEGGQRPLPGQAQLVGVVSSGNLEVLIEAADLHGACELVVCTTASGFGSIWQAVMEDFHARWQLRDARLSLNDVGATPAVVNLRLDQAVEAMLGAPP